MPRAGTSILAFGVWRVLKSEAADGYQLGLCRFPDCLCFRDHWDDGGDRLLDGDSGAVICFWAQVENPIGMEPPNTELEELWFYIRLVFYIGSVISGLAVSGVGAWWAWKTKRDADKAKLEAEAHAREEERIKDFYERREAQQDTFHRDVLERLKFAETQKTEMMAQHTEAAKMIGDLQTKIISLEKEIHELRQELEYYKSNAALMVPREILEEVFDKGLITPSWLHAVGQSKWYLNETYCEEFSIESRSFWRPINIFGRFSATDATRYVENDLQVIRTNVPTEFTERVRRRIMDPDCNEFVLARIRKVPIVIQDQPYIFGKILEYVDEEKETDGVL